MPALMKIKVSHARRGRLFAAGMFVDFEEEIDTFKALAGKYLCGTLEVDMSSIDKPMFRVKDNVRASGSA